MRNVSAALALFLVIGTVPACGGGESDTAYFYSLAVGTWFLDMRTVAPSFRGVEHVYSDMSAHSDMSYDSGQTWCRQYHTLEFVEVDGMDMRQINAMVYESCGVAVGDTTSYFIRWIETETPRSTRLKGYEEGIDLDDPSTPKNYGYQCSTDPMVQFDDCDSGAGGPWEHGGYGVELPADPEPTPPTS